MKVIITSAFDFGAALSSSGALADGCVSQHGAERSLRTSAGARVCAGAGAAREPCGAVFVRSALGTSTGHPRVTARAFNALARCGMSARYALSFHAAPNSRTNFATRTAFAALVIRAVVVAMTLHCNNYNI